jgi:polar amino acid transport system substrate-binding protein
MRRAGVLVLVGVAALVGLGCDQVRDNAEQQFDPHVDGVLTVATSLPAPGFWEGADASSLDGGFEWEIADALAARFHLDLDVVDVPFESIVAGDLGDADMAIAQISITDERAEVVDFSTSYYVTGAGVLGAAGADELTDLKSAKEQTWVVVGGTTEETFVNDVIRPDDDPLVVEDDQAAADAVAAGTVDVALLDLSSALVLTNDDAQLAVLGRFATDQRYAIALPHDTSDQDRRNQDAVDAAIRALDADGSLEQFAHDWLVPAYGADVSDIPIIPT